MFRRNKERYCPVFWSRGITEWHKNALASHALNGALEDRYRRGMKAWAKLLDLPWYAWRRDRVVVRELGILCAEYRELLEAHFDALRTPPPIVYAYPSKLGSMRTPERRRARPDEVPYGPTYSNYPIELPVGAVIDISELTKGDIKPFDFRADVHHQDNTPSFGGAGASGDWGGSSDTSAPDIDVPDLD